MNKHEKVNICFRCHEIQIICVRYGTVPRMPEKRGENFTIFSGTTIIEVNIRRQSQVKERRKAWLETLGRLNASPNPAPL
jgi:hypothetical protein